MPTFKDCPARGVDPGKRSGGKPKGQLASGDLPTLRQGPYTMGNGTNEMPNSVTSGDVSMRAQNRYGKNDRMPDTDIFKLG